MRLDKGNERRGKCCECANVRRCGQEENPSGGAQPLPSLVIPKIVHGRIRGALGHSQYSSGEEEETYAGCEEGGRDIRRIIPKYSRPPSTRATSSNEPSSCRIETVPWFAVREIPMARDPAYAYAGLPVSAEGHTGERVGGTRKK
jgi:hypothetical protein